MSENFEDLGDLGEKIKDIIDRAVSTKDYRQMTEDIRETVGETVNRAVNSAVDSGGEAIKNGLNSVFGTGNAQSGDHEKYQNKTKEFEERRKREREQAKEQERELARKQQERKRELAVLYEKNTGGKMKGLMLSISGGILASGMGLGTLALSIFGAVGHMNSLVIGGTCFMVAGALTGFGLLAGGLKKLGKLERFQKYVGTLGTHTYCNLEQLSQAVNKPVKFVKKDVRKMIDSGWFRQGHMDAQETCLITSNETYDQYVSTQKRLEERNHQQDEERARQEAALRQQAEEKERQKFNQHEQADARACVEAERDAAERIRLSPEVRQVLDKGNDFLDKIHRSNDAIPGEEISRKISRMELIIAKIFERAKAHPEIIPDLNRLMDYYLPMTVKLLNAYEEMDSQPVQGENITSSKKEIEETIDTLNVAFEKLLDSIFEDTAMDVSSDISVLNTVLAQEGLTEDELTRMRKEAEKNRL